jgi:hypothetical protein
MSTIPLKIFVHGLVALVPTAIPGHMAALLVDGRMPMQEQCMMEHHPQLSFFVGESADCISVPGCSLSGNQCTCKHTANLDPIVGKQIYLEVHPDPTFAPDKPASAPPPGDPQSSLLSLPVSKDQASSFPYVASLVQKPFNLTLNPIYLADNPTQIARDHLVARMDVPYAKDAQSGIDNLTACALATREDGGLAYVHSMSFRKLHVQSAPDDPNYALAQKVIAVFDVPDAPLGKQIVKLHIRNFDGTNDHAFTLLAGPDAYRIDVGNDPDAPLDRDDPCDDGVARHFMHFYDLANEVTAPADRLYPHVKFTKHVKMDDVKPAVCDDPIFGLANRPICPLVTFN